MDDAANPVEAIFNAALRQPDSAQRAAYLDAACGKDVPLRARVEALLGAHDEAGHFLSAPLAPASGSVADETLGTGADRDPAAIRRPSALPRAALMSEQPGSIIDHYKLLQRIGEGGFGTVWMADQEKPVRRRVALKIIKAGMDTKEVIARFEQERQALAMMDHPNIARVLDAGATQTGRPYFVMELVRGVKITEYCDAQGLATDERISLFITVCHAIQHAHQKGIIHRDLKPSNILVTVNDGEAVPKVIDFGVAKATQGRLTDGTLFTQFEQMIGTPLYMSPEQAEITSLDVDTRSDIYALGVLLYELLTGRTPIDTATMAKAGMDEVRRLIREVDPPRPSARLRSLGGQELTTVAKRRHTEPAKLSGFLRGDIDWIVMKCLEKDRKRRYDTANGLAMDLQRHLANEVVIARPPTTAYLLSKLVRRNRAACVAGGAIVLTLLVGIAASLWQAVRADREATRARLAEHRAVATVDELRATAPAFAEQAHALAAREKFGEAIEKLDYALKLRPDGAEYLVAKADLLQCQLKLAEAAAIYREALRVKPSLARAEKSAALCDELLAAPAGKDGKLAREGLARLHVEMQKQQRPAAELMPVARLLGEEKKLVVEYWLARLKDLPVSAERPLKDRLTVRDDGRLALDLSDTKVIDLAPLAGAPLGELDLSHCKDLTDIAPLRGLDLIRLNISATAVADLTPLREMRSLERLELSRSRVSDLTPISRLRLRSLNFYQCRVTDLTPLRGMALEEISLRKTRVVDLAPLDGMPIRSIDLSYTPVTNFSPLAKLPLEKCYLEGCQITDLAVLRGRPLTELVLLHCQQAVNYAALTEIKTLELLQLNAFYRNLPPHEYAAIETLRGHPNLRQLGAGVFDALEQAQESKSDTRSELLYAATGSADSFWQDWDRDQAYLRALRRSGIRFNLHRHLGGHDHLIIFDQPLRDLSILKGSPIAMLTLQGCQVTDLTPLRDLKHLQFLQLNTNLVSDLTPLRGMRLETVMLAGSKFSDLSPLEGMPIKSIYLSASTNITDVGVLATMAGLQNVTVPSHARKINDLRKLPKLERIAFNQSQANVDIALPDTSAEEFWKDYDWIGRLYEAGLQPKLAKLADGTWSVNLTDSGIADLEPFDGAPVSELWLGNTVVSDLTPLKKTPLKRLWIYNTSVTDLSPLKGMPLEMLQIGGTRVTDISVIRGMPLVLLRLHSCQDLTDLSPLEDLKELLTLTLPPKAKSFDFLHNLPKLTHIGLKEINGNPDKTVAAFWKEQDLAWVKALRDAGIDIKQLQELPDGTWHVSLSDSTISDLAILKGARISDLAIERTPVLDLTPLRELSLKRLWLAGTRVTDFSPLQGLQLSFLHLGWTDEKDLSAIRGLPLTELWLDNCRQLKDVSALRGMPLTILRLHGSTELTDLSPLADMKTLTSITLPPNATDFEFLRKFPALERIGFKEDAQNGYRSDKTADEFWKEYDGQAWLRNLRKTGVAIRAVKQLPDGTWELNLALSTISDLTVLKGAPVSSLNLGDTAVADLAPLEGMPLKDLRVFRSNVTDLSPLKGIAIEQLHLSGTGVTDLSPLRGMPLTYLKLHDCAALTDVSTLADCKALRQLTLPPNAKNIEFLRALTTIERISFSEDPKNGYRPTRTAAQFWTNYDEQVAINTAIVKAGFTIKALSRQADGTWDVDLTASPVGDLKALAALPLSALRMGNTAITDLEPLRGMPLSILYVFNSKVTDLAPLKGMKLDRLSISGTKVTDLSPLAGMPLTFLRLHDCTELTDLAPLAECKALVNITVPRQAKNLEELRGLPKLERIGYVDDPKNGYRPDRSAAEFWAAFDAKKEK